MTTRLRTGNRSTVLPSLFLLLFTLGCGSIGKDKQVDFLKPFASTAPHKAPIYSQTMPSEYTLCVETAKTVAQQGHAVEAIKLYERAETLSPELAALNAELAPLYASVKNYDDSITRYQRCVKDSPTNIELSNNFAWTLMEARRYEEALTEATRGLQCEGDTTRLQATLAMIHYHRGDHTKAYQQFEKAHGPTAAHHNLSLLEIDSGNLESAMVHLRIANQTPLPNAETEVLLTALESQTTQH